MPSIMDPGRDWSWIYRIASSIQARHKPARSKRHRLVHSEKLLDLGLGLMVNAEAQRTALRRFKTYRDGLLIATLASRQLRLRNLTGLILGQTLVRRGDGWWIQIPATETKTKDPIEAPWPEMLVRHPQQPPAGLWGMPPELLQALTGYDPDVQKNRAEARRVMHDPAYVTLSFDEDVDKCLAVAEARLRTG